jgi:acyl carrier protein
MNKKLMEIINSILEKKDKTLGEDIDMSTSLRKDVGFDSFDLAELTVLVEDEFGVDIFADGLVDTLEEIEAKLHG